MTHINGHTTQTNSQTLPRFYGKYRGVVTDNEDPLQIGRVRVDVPEIFGDYSSGWASPCVPYAGGNSGQYMIPDIDAGVWVEFEAGDISRPIWSGCWWGFGDQPEDNAGGSGVPALKIIRTEEGMMIAFDDAAQLLTVGDERGNNLLEIQITAGKITIKGEVKAVVEAPRIELVENANHPVVFGDELISYLTQITNMYNTHVHPGELAAGVLPVTPAPPVPPMSPPTPSLISTKVNTG